MARRGKKFGTLLRVTLFASVLALAAVPIAPKVAEQWRAWILCGQLRDPDPQIRRGAAEGLARLGPAAAPWAIQASRDASAEARVAACSILRLVSPERPRAGVDALIVATGDDQQHVRSMAVEQLADALGNPAAKADARLRDRALAALRRTLEDPSPQIRISAAWGLIRVDPDGSRRPVIGAMRAIALDPIQTSTMEHSASLRVLKATLGADGLAAILIASLGTATDKDAVLRDLMQECPDGRGIEPILIGALKAADGIVRCDVALHLLGRDARGEGPALATLMEDLAGAREGTYVPADLVRMIRERAPGSLGQVVRAMIDALPGSRGRLFPLAAIDTLAAIGPEAKPSVPALLEIANSDDLPLARAALVSLATIDPPSIATKVPLLIDRAGSGDIGGRLVALAILRDLGPAAMAAVPALVAMADEDDIRASAAAIEALSRIDPPRAAAIKRAARD